jgi:hypothetical protein
MEIDFRAAVLVGGEHMFEGVGLFARYVSTFCILSKIK